MSLGNDVYAIRHHRTNILTYFPDGTIKVIPWDSATTRKHLWEYAGVQLARQNIPAFNGRSPSPHRVLSIKVRTDPNWYVHSSFMILPNGMIHEDSIEPAKCEVIVDKTYIKEFRQRTKERIDQLRIRKRLGAKVNGRLDLYRWMQLNYLRPLDECYYEDIWEVAPYKIDLKNLLYEFIPAKAKRTVSFRRIPVEGIQL